MSAITQFLVLNIPSSAVPPSTFPPPLAFLSPPQPITHVQRHLLVGQLAGSDRQRMQSSEAFSCLRNSPCGMQVWARTTSSLPRSPSVSLTLSWPAVTRSASDFVYGRRTCRLWRKRRSVNCHKTGLGLGEQSETPGGHERYRLFPSRCKFPSVAI